MKSNQTPQFLMSVLNCNYRIIQMKKNIKQKTQSINIYPILIHPYKSQNIYKMFWIEPEPTQTLCHIIFRSWKLIKWRFRRRKKKRKNKNISLERARITQEIFQFRSFEQHKPIYQMHPVQKSRHLISKSSWICISILYCGCAQTITEEHIYISFVVIAQLGNFYNAK